MTAPDYMTKPLENLLARTGASIHGRANSVLIASALVSFSRNSHIVRASATRSERPNPRKRMNDRRENHQVFRRVQLLSPPGISRNRQEPSHAPDRRLSPRAPANDPQYQRTPASVPPCPRSITTWPSESARRRFGQGLWRCPAALLRSGLRPFRRARQLRRMLGSHVRGPLCIGLARRAGAARSALRLHILYGSQRVSPAMESFPHGWGSG